MRPLLTLQVHEALIAARRAGRARIECSLDLQRSMTSVEIDGAGWTWHERQYPYLDACKDRTIYHWIEAGPSPGEGARLPDATGEGELGRAGAFAPVARYTASLVKLVPTPWGAPTFEIDGIKMLPTAQISPYEDARRKVDLIQPRGRQILDTCGGLGYFAAWCLQKQAAGVLSFEKSEDVLWLRSINPWSPSAAGALRLVHADVLERIPGLPDASFDAILHDPPRFAIAGDLYSQDFYAQLARVLRVGGRMFHYTGAPNRLARARDLPGEVTRRLQHAGFEARPTGDGVFAVKRPSRARR